ncbi:MAG TPA: hypothetical protein VFR58_13775 [Flavisolibacter sp.]|nr:hypothetical protein [Flavisolibacter sp.]
MTDVLDLRDVFEYGHGKMLQVETKYGDVIQGKLIIVDMFSGRKGTFRKIVDLQEYSESRGQRGIQEITLHTIDIKSLRHLE